MANSSMKRKGSQTRQVRRLAYRSGPKHHRVCGDGTVKIGDNPFSWFQATVGGQSLDHNGR